MRLTISDKIILFYHIYFNPALIFQGRDFLFFEYLKEVLLNVNWSDKNCLKKKL